MVIQIIKYTQVKNIRVGSWTRGQPDCGSTGLLCRWNLPDKNAISHSRDLPDPGIQPHLVHLPALAGSLSLHHLGSLNNQKLGLR